VGGGSKVLGHNPETTSQSRADYRLALMSSRNGSCTAGEVQNALLISIEYHMMPRTIAQI